MRNLSTLLGLALFGAVAVSSASSSAQTTPGPAMTAPTVAVVDMQRVLAESAAGKSIQGQLDTERRKIRDQVAKLDEEFKASENEFRRQRAVLSPDAQQEQVQALQRKQAEGQRFLQDRQEAFQKGESDALNVVSDNMRDIVQQLATERHVGMVLRKEIVLSLADKNMDITDDVISRLNTKLPSVTVSIPAPGAAPQAPAAADAQPAAAVAPEKGKKK
jgi:Skp family chaperone for outer membrane proteins